MSRTYIVFGSNDGGQTLAPVGTFDAADHDSAKKQAAKTNDYKEYGSCPVGNWSFGMVREKVIIEVVETQMRLPEQLTVDDVLHAKEPEDDGA